MGQCRETRLASSLGWGAFLKDETLRTPEGKVMRVAQGPCPIPTPVFSLPCIGHKLSEECLLPQDCCMAGDASSQDCTMSFTTDSSSTGIEAFRRRSGDDCEMPSWDAFNYSPLDIEMNPAPDWGHGPLELGGSGEQLCVKTADEMFMMFIDETCMDVTEGD